MPNASLLAEFVAAADRADQAAEDLIVIEADALAEGLDVDIEKTDTEWNAVMRAYFVGDDAEYRLRSRLLIEALVDLGARALRRAVKAEGIAA